MDKQPRSHNPPKKLLSRHEIPVRWVDIDAYHHMNNSRYFDLMSESRARDLVEIGSDCAFVIAECKCKFKAPVFYPSTLIIEHYVHSLKLSSFETTYLFKDKMTGRTLAEGQAVVVCCSIENPAKPIRMPVKVKEFLEGKDRKENE